MLQTLQFHTLSLKFALSCLNPTFHPSFCRHGRAGRAFVCYLLYKQVYGRFQLRNTLDLCIWYKYINDFILFNLSILFLLTTQFIYLSIIIYIGNHLHKWEEIWHLKYGNTLGQQYDRCNITYKPYNKSRKNLQGNHNSQGVNHNLQGKHNSLIEFTYR